MTSAKVLSQLTTKTLVPNGEGFGGFSRLEPCDVAYALGGLPGGPTTLMRAMYGGDTSDINMRALYLWAWQAAIDLAIEKGWRVPKGKEVLRNIARQACDELVYPRVMNCPNCNGTSRVHPNQHNPDGLCRLCSETGKRVRPDEEMAAYTGLTEDEWREIWKPRYPQIKAIYDGWEIIGIVNIRRRLASD